MLLSPLEIAITEETPGIYFAPDKGVMKITGRSLPENAHSFFQPIIDWTREMVVHINHEVRFEIQLDYFNSSSGRFLYELLSVIESSSKSRNHLHIVWCVEKDDELMIEKGEELRELLNLHFELSLI
jgi:hypothetical protein